MACRVVNTSLDLIEGFDRDKTSLYKVIIGVKPEVITRLIDKLNLIIVLVKQGTKQRIFMTVIYDGLIKPYGIKTGLLNRKDGRGETFILTF